MVHQANATGQAITRAIAGEMVRDLAARLAARGYRVALPAARHCGEGAAVITCWLWDAGSACGVTNEEPRARRAAAEFLRTGRADTARVEKALLVPGTDTLTMVHARTGVGWSAHRHRDRRITWKPLPAARELAAS